MRKSAQLHALSCNQGLSGIMNSAITHVNSTFTSCDIWKNRLPKIHCAKKLTRCLKDRRTFCLGDTMIIMIDGAFCTQALKPTTFRIVRWSFEDYPRGTRHCGQFNPSIRAYRALRKAIAEESANRVFPFSAIPTAPHRSATKIDFLHNIRPRGTTTRGRGVGDHRPFTH